MQAFLHPHPSIHPTASERRNYVMAFQVYREKIKAEIEGRPYTPPAPSSLAAASPASLKQGSRPSSVMGSRPGSSRNLRAGGGGEDDGWGDWGGNEGGGGGGGGGGNSGGFGSNSEYTRSQYMDSANHKEEFFSRKMQVGGWVV